MVWRKLTKGELSPNIEANISYIKGQMAEGLDIIYREFRLGNGQKAFAFFLEGLVNRDILDRDLFRPLMLAQDKGFYQIEELAEQILPAASVKTCPDLDTLIEGALQGLTVLIVDGNSLGLHVEAVGWQQRGINEPSTDIVIRGPREGFVETMRINIAMMRRKIHHPSLTVETMRLGRLSKTDLAIIYIDGVVNKSVLKEAKRRLAKIDIDGILDSGYIEQLIQDTPYSAFPTIGITEKPDIAAARILEGRLMLIIDGSPVALTMPMFFIEGLQSPEDYYTRFFYASFIRLIRGLALIIALLLPGSYIAVASYHQQLIPVNLMFSMLSAEANTPFSAGTSIVLISLAYEILREAGVRLPRPAGQAVSIVGAIIMGDAAVSAGLISAPILIVLAITVISSYIAANLVDAVTILRLAFIALGWSLGMFGILFGIITLMMYLSSLRSFGIPYFSPFAPLATSGLQDSFVRFPLFKMIKRPTFLSKNRQRMSPDMRREMFKGVGDEN